MRKVLLYFAVAVLLTSGLARADCTGEAECYDSTPAPDQAPHSGWPADDRLNPVQDEYYTVYCHFDQVEVWRAAGGSEQLASIPISRIMAATRPFDGGNGLRVSRSGDQVTISGSNGNNAAQSGAKSFTLSECIERNGGAPTVQTAPNTVREAQVVPPAQACTYYFGPAYVTQLPDPRSHAESVVGADGQCQPPAPGAHCEALVLIDATSLGDRSILLPMSGTVDQTGDCVPDSNPALLLSGMVQAFANWLCLGVYGVPLGGGLWLKRRLYRRRGRTLPFGR